MSLPLSAQTIEEKLDECLDAVLSSRRTATGLANTLAAFEREQQDFVLAWVEIIAKTNAEMAYQFAQHAPEALRLMSAADVEAWVIQAMDVYDRNGLYPGCSALRQVHDFAAEASAAAHGASFDEVAGMLELFLRGLSGRRLKLETAPETYTDTTTLFLPARLAVFPARADNVRLYKAIAAHLWAQAWYGTFRLDADGPMASPRYPSDGRALCVFHALETIRLDACLARELPGLYRDMQQLQSLVGGIDYPAGWRAAAERLRAREAGVEDSLALLPALLDRDAPAACCYQGVLFPDRVEAAQRERLARERDELRLALARLAEDHADKVAAAEGGARVAARPRFRLEPDADRAELGFTLTLDGRPVEPPAEVRALIASILQDLGEIPDEYLVPAGDGEYRREVDEKRPEDVWKGTYHEEGAFPYNEWDHRRRHYRKDWCVLRELDVHPSEEPFARRTLNKYAGLLGDLRKTFEALRGEDRVLKKQTSGDDVDFDALVEARADMHHGMELSDRLFTKLSKLERDIAVIFLVDMSGSTKGWINDAERESLVLLCEALDILGDRYAIYGFSGMTRKRCELYRVKRFDEPYTEDVRRRIAGMRPQDYTRMGVVIRHMTRLFGDIEARTKLLITLSDGKPDDYDGYRGEYGIEDTRQALLEAKHAGIHPFCITIDSEARDYLPHMYGHVNYALVDDVRRLPLKVSEIYRRLTL
jgi:nitric oxide reductase NorD protein